MDAPIRDSSSKKEWLSKLSEVEQPFYAKPKFNEMEEENIQFAIATKMTPQTIISLAKKRFADDPKKEDIIITIIGSLAYEDPYKIVKQVTLLVPSPLIHPERDISYFKRVEEFFKKYEITCLISHNK